MKPIRLSILTLLLLSSALMQGQSDTISWHDGVKITWADFKGAPNKSVPYFANTTYLISIGYKYRGSDAKIHVGCYFDRDKSWVIKSKEKDSLLLHEKLHFAIAELFARKARKIITDTALQASDINNVLNAIDERVMKECDEYQDQYDNETNHSIITAKQIEWMKKVYLELDALKAYSNTEIEKTLQ